MNFPNILPDNGLDVGKVLISFNLLEYDQPIPKSLRAFEPPSERFTIKIRILGLRGLKSSGILSVQKAFLKFDVHGLNPIGLKDPEMLVVRAPEAGPDPNFCMILRFDADLPIDPKICPSLTCLVLDTVWEGVIQPIIGSFAIDLGEIMASDEELMKKPHKLQSHFMMKHPQYHKGETDDPIVVEIESEKTKLIKKSKSKEEKLDENAMLSDKLVRKIRKYPPVLTEDGELQQEYMIIKPKYVKAPKKQFMMEEEIPDPESYLGLGHDKREEKLTQTTKRHYRYYINQELERTKFMNQNLFNQFPIYKGKRMVENDLFQAFSLDVRQEQVGLFKGWINITRAVEQEENVKKGHGTLITVMEKNEGNFNESEGKIHENIKEKHNDNFNNEDKEFDELDSLILKSEQFLVRVYVVDALNLQPMDNDSLSDPYVRIVLGDVKIDVNSIRY